MDKISYILDLTNVTMPDNVRAETEKKIRGAEEAYEKKRGRKTALLIIASVLAFAALVLFVFLIVKTAQRPDTPDDTQTTEISGTNAETQTDPPESHAGSYIFASLYDGTQLYTPLKTAAQLFIPYGDQIITADDLSPLSQYFDSQYVTADRMCDTFFAFYESGCVRNINSISQYSDDELEQIKKDLLKMNDYNGLYHDEIILLSAKNGTFEYLFTVSVMTDKAPGDLLQPGVRVYDLDRHQIGECYEDNSYGCRYKITKTAFEHLNFSIYKIRIEMGLPVIYGKYSVNNEELFMPENEMQSGFIGIGLVTSDMNSEDSVIKCGNFKVEKSIVALTPDENNMSAPIGTGIERKVAATAQTLPVDPASDSVIDALDVIPLCDYPYSLPIYGETKYTCNRKDACRIINQLGLQWFFPMYVTQTANGLLVIGDGIKTGANAFGTDHIYSSIMYRLYGTEYEDGIYTTYYGNLNEDGDLFGNTSMYNVGVCYFPQTCDRPYFDSSYFEKDHALIKVLIKDGVVKESTAIPDDKLAEQLRSSLNVTPLKPTKAADYVYIKDPNYNYSPARPFSAELTQFLEEELTKTPDLFEGLGFSVKPYNRIDNSFYSVLSLGYRKMNITAVHEEIIQYKEWDREEPLKQYTVYAYEEKGRFVIDTSGCIYGIKAEDGAYVFTTYRACNTICVMAEGDNVIYSYCGDSSGNYIDGSLNGVRDITEHGPGWGAVSYIISRTINNQAPILGYQDEQYYPGTDKYVIKVDTMMMPQKTVYFCRETNASDTGSSSRYVCGYYPNLSLFVRGGRLFWDCPGDDYAHGHTEYTLQIQGDEITVTDIESRYANAK